MFKIREKNNVDHKVKYILDVDQKTWTDAYQKKLNADVKNVKIQGFRKGHVPFNEAVKYINHANVYDRAINSLTQPIYTELVKQEKLTESEEVLEERPDVEVIELDDQKLALSYAFETVPTVKLGDYSSISGFVETKPVDDEELQKELVRIFKSASKLVDKAAGSTLEKGDIAFLDFSGEIDGKAFEGGKAKNYELEIGSNSFIPGFEDQMVGMKVEEKRNLDLTFPKDYHEKTYAGKPVLFKVKLNAIKEVQLPEMTVEKLNEIMRTSYKSLDEAKQDIKQRIEINKNERISQMNTMLLNQFAVDKCEFSHIPKTLIDREVQLLYRQFENQMAQIKMSVDDALKIQNKTKEQLYNNLTEQATKAIKLVLVLEEIASVEKVEATEEDVQKEIEQQIKTMTNNQELQKDQLEALKGYLSGQKELFESMIINKKTVDLIIQKNLKK
ncbi:trigger factor [Mycoplasma bradburyae]|uniref:trigger factor n=1 Tax=Mycoplasma bradburyae TaxID=2963128 RepID=UPI0023406CAC|nr:trigger factor [Mycoplasma bradburyae]MDC4182769.1 trigger factor [Mycoplasma bradburyae]